MLRRKNKVLNVNVMEIKPQTRENNDNKLNNHDKVSNVKKCDDNVLIFWFYLCLPFRRALVYTCCECCFTRVHTVRIFDPRRPLHAVAPPRGFTRSLRPDLPAVKLLQLKAGQSLQQNCPSLRPKFPPANLLQLKAGQSLQ